jgi:hypothetical protein
MATKTTYVATAPDGTEFTRTTARAYTHAVLCHVEDNEVKGIPAHWGKISFNSRAELAEQEANCWRGRTCFGDGEFWDQVIVVPVAPKAGA